MNRSLFATLCTVFGVTLVVFASSASMALADFEVDPISLALCRDPQNQCRDRSSNDPATPAACSTTPEVCERTAEGDPTDICACQRNPTDNTKCYCKVSSAP